MGRRCHILLVYLLTSSHREYFEFVLPRYPYLDSESSLYELLPRYSRATLTGFCPIETRKWQEEHSDDPDNLDNLDDTQIFHYGCDNHIFIDKDLQPDVACVFVMAEQRNIYHALSSALYHRRAVGIHEPIIGLTFGEHGSSLHLVLAWLEKDMIQLDQALVSFSLAAFPPLSLSFVTFLAGGSPCTCSVRSGWYNLEWCLRHAQSDSSTLSYPCTTLSAPESCMHNLPGDSREQILTDEHRYAAGSFLAR